MYKDIITTDFWEQQCDFGWNKNNPVDKTGMVFCPNEGVVEFFEWAKTSKNKFILVSAYSDFSLVYQSEYHPNKDMMQRVNLIDYDAVSQVRDKYVVIPLSCASEQCLPSDKFSLKINSYTEATFNEIPDNIVKWFVVNNNVREDRVEWIPFGMNWQGHGKDIVSNYWKDLHEKERLLYLNFTNFTQERMKLKMFYNHKYPTERDRLWLTIEDGRRTIEEFYQDLANHMFVMCPWGNGIDSFRIWETFAVGSIPILKNCEWARNFIKMGLPVILVDNLFGLHYDILIEAANKLQGAKFDLSCITKQFWAEKLTQSRSLLNNLEKKDE